MRRSGAFVVLASIALGCTRETPAQTATTTSATTAVSTGAPPEGLPSLVVATRKTTVMTGGEKRIPFARPRAALPVTVRESSTDGRELLIHIGGGIELDGVIAPDDLGVLVCDAGPIGDHFYAGHENLVSLRSTITDGRVHIGGDVLTRVQPHDPNASFTQQFQTTPFEGDIAASRLCTQPPQKRAVSHVLGEIDTGDFPSGTQVVDIERGAPLSLLAAPGGAPVYTRPADPWGYSLAVVRHEGAWDYVAAGNGPYILGWVPARAPRPAALQGGLASAPPIGPASLQHTRYARMPLHELADGTEVQQFGIVRARLKKPGFARVSSAHEGWQYVVAAVDDDVVVEGWIDPTRLGKKLVDAAQ